MSRKSQLRVQRTGTIINATAKEQEKECFNALIEVTTQLQQKFLVKLDHSKSLTLSAVVSKLRDSFPTVQFANVLPTSTMKPDGGIVYLVSKETENLRLPILITEVKNQGTNDLRAKEGKTAQAKGNAIERLGKNVIGFRAYLMGESIFPFVCFGYGCDFEEKSSILDRVVTINMFGKLNRIVVNNEGENEIFNRGSFFFREQKWSTSEMVTIMMDIAERSIYHYFGKYGEKAFR